ncbi:DUF2569 family protein [Mesorhizobium sp. LHD-90]|uniref:DUF2569 family protein n=1 Tax=Mesorhizobium sp. LHD-90 TaxID=3071414 RepID=UPI0027DF5211|nr:DUF2569 family protein [Mesorhizobium sp. LHD-90]MDQ6432446.1 DUF2569 family protein [Mesorhizobium sp. LHD-90]
MTIAPPQVPIDEPKGLGGWLILVMIGLMTAPLTGLAHLDVFVAFMKEILPKSHIDFLGAEFTAYVITSILFPTGLLILMFTKDRSFPAFYVVWAAINIVVIVVHVIAAKVLFGDLLHTRAMSLFGVVLNGVWRAVGLFGIGILYMLKSKRVRNTFIN